MNIIERQKFRTQVIEGVVDELDEMIKRNGRGSVTEARVRSSIKELISVYEAELKNPSNTDGGYTFAVSWLKSILKDKQFVENAAERNGIL